jgi:chromosome segregation ATPase
MEWWQTTLVAGAVSAVVGAVPIILLFVLQRKGANKQLQLQEGSLDVETFESQRKAYKELYDTAKADLSTASTKLDQANATSEALAAELRTYQEERERLMAQIEEQGRKIEKLEKSGNAQSDELADTRSKLENLRKLFTDVLARTGIQLTPEEQDAFEQTKPKWLINQETQKGGA